MHRSGSGLDVSFRIRNVGARTGSAVPQVYLGPSSEVRQPQVVRALAGFDKVTLRPGESRRVHVRLDAARLSYWNTTTHGWALGRGVRTLYVGSSSADLPLAASVRIH